MTDKFAFIEAECAIVDAQLPTVSRICALVGVSKSGYYEWRCRPVSAAQQRRELLADKIRALFKAFKATYGYRRIHAELLRGGTYEGRFDYGDVARIAMGAKGADPFGYRAEFVDLVAKARAAQAMPPLVR